MTKRDPNILEKILDYIPGYKEYSDREGRRDNDKRLRDHVADQLGASKRKFDDLVLALTKEAKLDSLDDAETIKKRIGICADTIRTAQYGASGLMDDVQIKAEDLDRVHEHDRGILDQTMRLVGTIEALTPDSFADEAADVRASVDELRSTIDQRDELFREIH